jgi:hypothetical protein
VSLERLRLKEELPSKYGNAKMFSYHSKPLNRKRLRRASK